MNGKGNKDTLIEAAQFVDQYTNPSMIDINMCLVLKITTRDAGARWLWEGKASY